MKFNVASLLAVTACSAVLVATLLNPCVYSEILFSICFGSAILFAALKCWNSPPPTRTHWIVFLVVTMVYYGFTWTPDSNRNCPRTHGAEPTTRLTRWAFSCLLDAELIQPKVIARQKSNRPGKRQDSTKADSDSVSLLYGNGQRIENTDDDPFSDGLQPPVAFRWQDPGNTPKEINIESKFESNNGGATAGFGNQENGFASSESPLREDFDAQEDFDSLIQLIQQTTDESDWVETNTAILPFPITIQCLIPSDPMDEQRTSFIRIGHQFWALLLGGLSLITFRKASQAVA